MREGAPPSPGPTRRQLVRQRLRRHRSFVLPSPSRVAVRAPSRHSRCRIPFESPSAVTRTVSLRTPSPLRWASTSGPRIGARVWTRIGGLTWTVMGRTGRKIRRSPRWSTGTEGLLRGEGMIDFEDMVLIGLRLIESHRWVRRALRAKFPVLVVDEYQDLGVPLHRIVQSLCFRAGVRLFAVGDPDQSIYGFTGARPDLLRRAVAGARRRDRATAVQLSEWPNHHCRLRNRVGGSKRLSIACTGSRHR